MSSNNKRTFDALRARPARSVVTSQDEPIEAKARRLFLAGADGPAVLAWLVDRANQVTPIGSSNDTLREAEGARRFIDGIVREITPA